MAFGLLDGRVAAVTGAGRGIGRAVAERFAAEGAAVAVIDIAADAAQETVAAIRAEGGRALALAADVTDEASVQAAVDAVVRELGGADVVVANAGVLVLERVLDMDLARWQRTLDVNLTGVFLTCRGFARDLVRRGTPGRVIATSSLFGRHGGVENAAYSATKWGVIGFVQCLAAELAEHDILVNAVCPGQIQTDMIDALVRERTAMTGQAPTAVRRALVDRVALGRLGTVEEVADTFVYLASPLAAYVTGQAVVVDGGWEVG